VPIPYPNTGMASDLTDGSTTVTIGGNPVCLKDKSSFKKTSGDEAGSAPLKGLVSASNAGALFFAAWSMDVKVEGENVVRNLDVGTHNHASQVGNGPPWPFMASMTGPVPPGQPPAPCSAEADKRESACSGKETKKARCDTPACREAMKCELQPYTKGKESGCCAGQTPHHLIEVHSFTQVGQREAGARLQGFEKYSDKSAPCVCCDQSSRYTGDHGSMHAIQGMAERGCMDPSGARSQMGGQNNQWTYKASKDAGITAHQETFKSAACSSACLGAQLDSYHNNIGVTDSTPLRADRSPLSDEQKTFGASVLNRAAPEAM
jgi:hypothetical protein